MASLKQSSQAYCGTLGTVEPDLGIAWVRVNATGTDQPFILRMRSSAPCRIIVAASLSMTCARRRLASASSSVRSAAAVERRSSHKRMGSGAQRVEVAREGPGRLHARPCRTVEVGRQPKHEAGDVVLRGRAQQLGRIFLELVRRMTVSGEAMVRVTSDRARPSVLVPASMPMRRPAGEPRGKGLDVVECRAVTTRSPVEFAI